MRARAFSGYGLGTQESPYVINTCVQLDEMRYDESAHYVLGQDVDCWMTSPTGVGFDANGIWGDGKGWEPVRISGSLDGRNHTISRLYVNRPDEDDIAFSNYTNGTIKNLKVTLAVTGRDRVAGLVSQTDTSARLSNIDVTGTINGHSYVGGFAYRLVSLNTPDKLSFDGTINASSSYVGGFAQSVANTTVTNSYANVTINGSTHIGGFVESLYSDTGSEAKIEKSYSTGTINFVGLTGAANIGGFAANVQQYSSGAVQINDSFTTVNGSSADSSQVPSIDSKIGSPTTSNFIYSGDDAKINTCASLSCTAVNEDGSDPSHFMGIAAADVTNGVQPLKTWDFTTTWLATDGEYPVLRQVSSLDTLPDYSVPSSPTNLQINRVAAHSYAVSWSEPTDNGNSDITQYIVDWAPTLGAEPWGHEVTTLGTSVTLTGLPLGTNVSIRVRAENAVGVSSSFITQAVDIPALIPVTTCEDLQDIALDPLGAYVLQNDIDCTMTNPSSPNFDPEGPWASGDGFTPIDTFSGELLGTNGETTYAINGLYIHLPFSGGVGMIRELTSGGVVSDISLTNALIHGGSGVGGVTAAMRNATITNVHFSGEVLGDLSVGGLVGQLLPAGDDPITVSNNVVEVTMSASDSNPFGWGGLIGEVSANDQYIVLTSNSVDLSYNDANLQLGGWLAG